MSTESGIPPVSNYRNFPRSQQNERLVGTAVVPNSSEGLVPRSNYKLRYSSCAVIKKYLESSMDPEWTCKSSTSITDDDAIGFLRDFLGSASSGSAMMDQDVETSSHPSGADALRANAQMNPPRKCTYADMSRLLKGMKADARAQRARER
jgi:hypothetical protein